MKQNPVTRGAITLPHFSLRPLRDAAVAAALLLLPMGALHSADAPQKTSAPGFDAKAVR
jgi:hypothetical protein